MSPHSFFPLLLSVVILHATAPARAASDPSVAPVEQTPSKTAPDSADGDDSLTTEVADDPWVPVNPLWHVFALPEYLTEAAFIPLAFVISATESYRLDRRVYDLLVSDDGTIMLVPNVKVSGSDGFGGGATLVFRRLFGTEDRFAAGGTIRINGDTEIGARYEHTVASLEGREIDLRVDLDRDRDLRWYGRGNDTGKDDRRALRSDSINAAATIELFGTGGNVGGHLSLQLREQTLGVGESPRFPAVMEEDRDVPPPARFGETLRYPRLGVSLTYDTRDSIGRPTVGVVGEAGAAITGDISGAHTSAFAGHVAGWTFIGVLPRHRTIALGAGGSFSLPLEPGDVVPMHELVVLGRESHLRGFDKQRFRDRFAWWASAEYRFPIWEFMTTTLEAAPLLFVDVGRVGHVASDLLTDPVHWSVGIGMRGAGDALELFTFTLGYSPEGVEVLFDIGGIL